MDNKIEFLVSEAVPSSQGFEVRGICNLGTIFINDIFTALVRDPGSGAFTANPITLKVKGITAYRRKINELPRGVSAELRCEGTAEGGIAPDDLLTA